MRRLTLAAALLCVAATASTPYTVTLSVAPATGVILPPVVPQPSAPGDVVGLILQGQGTHSVTFGQGFAKGAVLSSDTLMARVGAATYPVQVDPHARWSDGSVKHASLTLAVPLSGDTPVMLTKTFWGSGAPVSIAPSLVVAFSGDLTQTIDLGQALAASTATWMSGPLATERWVDVPVQNNFHVVAHWRQYADGSAVADVEFDNDITATVSEAKFSGQQPMPPPLHYDVAITVNGATTNVTNLVQYQYQDWHQVVRTDAAQVNVQEDVRYLMRAGFVPNYGLSGIAQTTFTNRVLATLSAPKFGVPLGLNGLMAYFGTTGGRPDIGPTTEWALIWLLTMRAEAAAVAKAQGDTGGSAPWNMWRSDGRWINNEAIPTLQVARQDGNSIAYSNVIPAWDATTIPPWANSANDRWVLDQAHQPNLSYVPFLLTADHWYWRRLAAQAAWDTVAGWTGTRCANGTPPCDAITWLRPGRDAAWEMREVGLASAVGPAGDIDQKNFTRVMEDNFAFLVAKQPAMWASSTPGATAKGWLLQGGGGGQISPWQQAFFSISVAWLGQATESHGPAAWLQFMRTWLSQSLLNTETGWNPLLGCTSYIKVATSDTAGWYATWTAIAADPVTQSHMPASISACYTQEASAGLASALAIRPDDTDLRAAYDWLSRQAAILDTTWQANPTWHIIPP